MKKILKIASILAIIAGIVLIISGVWGLKFTHKNVTQEKITTTPDSSLPNRLVSGPMTLKAQADIIRDHTLKVTDGNSKGEPLMAPNTARDLWITATTLTTALNLGIITYAFSGLIILFGLVSIMTGYVFSALSKRY